ncbi:SDR family oxidoreductase [Actinomadura keratinilytica]|jgi:NAD(P)-dependent dehydrogenase (short-subunit alcohol dehydrogenase family)|uniref:SDR family oxidoreductase n=1 Tax=Actinomadura keratinilytica TaxID=547461 RepID=A0ABP7Z951_9ACTN
MTTILIVGGTSGIGREIARHHTATGAEVIITGRDASRAATAAKEIGDGVRSLALDLARPAEIAPALADVEHVDHVVLTAIERDSNTAADYRLDDAQRLATLKLVGYTEVVHALLPRISRDGAVVLFGGLAKDRPYPGSTMVSAVNGAVVGLVHTLAVELAPIRVNAVHPGIIGDSPYWHDKPLDAVVSRTPGGRLATMDDVVDAVAFLLRNRGVNGVNLTVDGGWLLT